MTNLGRAAGRLGGVAIALLGLTNLAVAADVTLRSKLDSSLSITGDLSGFDGGKYTIVSPRLGTMTFEAARFDCVAGACPQGATAAGTRGQLAASSTGSTAGGIAIAGSNTIGNALMPALIEGYAQSIGARVNRLVGTNPLDIDFTLTGSDNREQKIALHRHGSTTAFEALEKRTAQIGMASRPVVPAEVARLQGAGLPDLSQPANEHVLGLDGLLILVAPGHPSVAVSLETLAKIFGGQITDWSQIGLPAGAIHVHAPTKESGTFETFDNLVLKPFKLTLTPSAIRTENHAEQSDQVARDPLAIGFTGVAYQRNAKSLNISLSCGLIAPPTLFSMKTEENPLSRRLFLYTEGQPREPLARSLLQFALSPAAQPIVKQNEFVDQTPERVSFADQEARILFGANAPAEAFDPALYRTLTTELKGSDRLSITFRFRRGSDALDTKAQADVTRLRELLATAAYRGATVYLVGFADAEGQFARNLNLSRNRAQAVLTALGDRTGGGVTVQTKAFSSLAPVSCNDYEERGRFLNRRVEVWVKR